ncbi:kinase-like domain-containing protein [Obelidium mucronatum]|nr:kinase-like domain-containing protein [Obelidium mucronatum]
MAIALNTTRTPSPCGSLTSASTSPVSTPPGLPTKPQPLYAGLGSEAKARAAVAAAFAQPLSAPKLLALYAAKRIIGFGSNGVVVAALCVATGRPVAVKVIYKNKPSLNTPPPAEVEVLKHLSATNYLLSYVEDWQDAIHFYVVTELFGSDWMAAMNSADSSDQLRPLNFRVAHNNTIVNISLPFSAGSSDLWAWSYAHRAHVFNTEGHSMLPLQPVKQIVKQVALGLAEMHRKGFYHGDIKIENVLVQSGGKVMGPQIRLADFGHSKHTSFGIKSYGTQEVSPPEFLADSPFSSEDIDGRAADIFALGMVLYVLLNDHGELPSAVKEVKAGRVGYERLASFRHGEYPLDDMTDLDADVWDLLFAMTRVDPTTRVSIHQVLAHPFFADV